MAITENSGTVEVIAQAELFLTRVRELKRLIALQEEHGTLNPTLRDAARRIMGRKAVESGSLGCYLCNGTGDARPSTALRELAWPGRVFCRPECQLHYHYFAAALRHLTDFGGK